MRTPLRGRVIRGYGRYNCTELDDQADTAAFSRSGTRFESRAHGSALICRVALTTRRPPRSGRGVRRFATPDMQVNRPGFVSWLIFDLDHTKAMIWEDAGLPAPNLIVRNRKSGHSHLYYAIPRLHDRGRPQQAHRLHEGHLRGSSLPGWMPTLTSTAAPWPRRRPSVVADAGAARPRLRAGGVGRLRGLGCVQPVGQGAALD